MTCSCHIFPKSKAIDLVQAQQGAIDHKREKQEKQAEARRKKDEEREAQERKVVRIRPAKRLNAFFLLRASRTKTHNEFPG